MTTYIFSNSVIAAREFVAENSIDVAAHKTRMITHHSAIQGEALTSLDCIFYSSDWHPNEDFNKLFKITEARFPGLIKTCEENGQKWLAGAPERKRQEEDRRAQAAQMRAELQAKSEALWKMRESTGLFVNLDRHEDDLRGAWYPDDPENIHVTMYDEYSCCGDGEQTEVIEISTLQDFLEEIAKRRK